MQRTKLSIRRVGVLLLTLCLSQTNGFSQIMPSLPDLFASPVNNYGNPPAPTVNCDMLETGKDADHQGLIKAIVWDEKDIYGNKYGISFFVEDFAGNQIVQSIPMGQISNPDIVLADDKQKPGVTLRQLFSKNCSA